MNADDVIESYVTDVSRLLPRKQRNDVAFELRALLNEELHARADASGHAADATMAIELVHAFGRPQEVAARYQPTLEIIDPADGRLFLRATMIGLAVIWALGLLGVLSQSIDSASGLLLAMGRWWTGTVVGSLWWPGALVVGFATAAWMRRRWPQNIPAWKPQADDRIPGGRAALVVGIIGIVCGVCVLMEPRKLLDVIWQGQAAPAAYQALTYTGTFIQRQAPWLLVLLSLNVPLLITVVAQGRWSILLRRVEAALGLATCAVMAWILADGPIFMMPASDRIAKVMILLSIAFTLFSLVAKAWRRVRPSPQHT